MQNGQPFPFLKLCAAELLPMVLWPLLVIVRAGQVSQPSDAVQKEKGILATDFVGLKIVPEFYPNSVKNSAIQSSEVKICSG